MRYGSVCSGIEAATVAWKPLGWEPAWFSEIEKFPCAVLKHHYRDVPNLGDITKITEAQLDEHGPIDVLVGGTPCQSFSVAGLRKGMEDPRGNLALRFLQLAGATRAKWLVWENVPGVLSSAGGRDFGTFLGALVQLGYGFAWRILDAQYFRVPQRRRRVFVVGYFGDWRRAAAVLFERESLRRYPPPSREAGASVAHTLARGACGSHGRYDPNGEDYVTGPLQSHSKEHGHAMTTQQAAEAGQVIPILEAGARQGHRDTPRDGIGIGEEGDPMFTLQSGKHHAIAFDTTQITSDKNYSNPKPGDACHPLASGQHPPAITIPLDMRNAGRDPEKHDEQNRQGVGVGQDGDPAPTVDTAHVDAVAYRTSGNCGVMEQGDRTAALNTATDPSQNIILQSITVRRLTPTESARLQGFPDDYLSQVTYRGKCPPADGPMYRALGNSFAVPVIKWIGERIKDLP